MRRGPGIAAAIVGVLLLVGIGIAAYSWGVHEGLERSGDAVEVVRYRGHGFGFPFGLLLFPLLLLALFAFKGFGWRHHDHGSGGPGHHGPGPGGWERGFEDWHRRQHEVGEGSSSSGGEPA